MTNNAPIAPNLDDEVSFISGITDAGTVAATSFWTWNGASPAGYGGFSGASKWGGARPGSPGGTVLYYFDPAANWTAAEKAGLVGGLDLWSAVANIQFAETSVASGANVTFKRGSDGGAYETAPARTPEPAGATALNSQGSGVVISIDTSVYGWQRIGSFTNAGGYDMNTVVHEEGHLLGLGHAGPYNGTVDSATDQYSGYDTRLWSLMSYIQPNDAAAKYAASYPVTGAAWGSDYPTTWMPLDILAAQRLYGVAASTPLDGGQVFGFHCNIAGAIEPFFDFTLNTTPVVTLYDTGGGNTLDLSGFSGPASINLNPGSFSSADGLVDNIAIAFGTAIDSAVGGAGGNTVFIVNADADTLTGHGAGNLAVFADSRASYGIALAGDTAEITDIATGAIDTLDDVQMAQFADGSVALECFLAGTRLATPWGGSAVERLVAGDIVSTTTGPARVRWRGVQTVATRGADPLVVLPIRIRAGALADGLPARDLFVSPGHAILLDGVLVQAGALVNGRSIARVTGGQVLLRYHHVELDSPALLIAEGVAAESYLVAEPGVFDNADGRPAAAPARELPYPRIKAQRQVPRALAARLAERAAMPGAMSAAA